MRRLLKYTTLILTVLMFSGSVWALNYTEHVTQAPNNKGDVLIFPWFLSADGGWQTKLTVINTDELNCVVAKLVVRSQVNSTELLDFFLYLSPADVWTGYIRYDSTRKLVVMFSNDDSAISALDVSTVPPTPTWASTTPINQPWQGTLCTSPADTQFMGYVEVIGIAAGTGSPGPGVPKSDIYKAYVNLSQPGATIGTSGAATLRFIDFIDNNVPADPYLYNRNVLAGYQKFTNGILGQSAELRATALKDYRNKGTATTSAETRLGVTADNNLLEVEAALSKDQVAMPYVNANDVAIHFFTFPTKLTQGCGSSALSPYFTQNSDANLCIPYSLRTYDVSENFPKSGTPFSGGSSSTALKFCKELDYIVSSPFIYTEGWAIYKFFKTVPSVDTFTKGTTFGDAVPLSFDGTPVLPTFAYIGASGLTAAYAAWTDDLVYCSLTQSTTSILPDYQYSDAATGVGCLTVPGTLK